MAEEKSSSFSLPSTGAVAVVLSLLGYLLITPNAFLDERPSITQSADNDKGHPQDIDARLWQDPFDAIKSDLEKSSTKSGKVTLTQSAGSSVQIDISGTLNPEDKDEHGSLKIRHSWPDTTKQKVTVIAAMVSGGPYSEMREVRIRRRYALVSALSTLHFKPDDPEHIGYFKPEFSGKSANPEQNNGTTLDSLSQGYVLPEAVPFEWFGQDDIQCTEERNAPLCRRVLVLWIDDARFNENPLQKIRQIFNLATPSSCATSKNPNPCIDVKSNNVNYAVIGPNDSGQLKALADDSEHLTALANAPELPKALDETAQDAAASNPIKPEDIRFYSAEATKEDDLIPGASKQGGLIKKLAGNKIQLSRVIADDRKVAERLVQELKLRQIDPKKDHVVLLSDWDTSYGRALPITFTAAYHGTKTAEWLEKNPDGCESSDKLFDNVHCFSYERGIDGKLPGNATDTKNSETKNDTKSAQQKSSDTYERPDGYSQKDYLRRLAEKIRALDRQLFQDEKGCFDPSRRCGVSAIGVLGYDIYDKLAILQALRSYFPGKIFFTTELDALYTSPKELLYTHNLIVGSSYGLSLRPEIQKNIPPFRDSYQTSFFLATLLAIKGDSDGLNANGINSKIEKWLKEARIFEIGRKNAVDLSGNKDYQACTDKFTLCNDIHPRGIFALPHGYEFALRVAFMLLTMALLYRASWKVRKLVVEDIREELKAFGILLPSKCLFFLLGMTTLIAFALIWAADRSDEPFLWVDGVSIWPAELLRILAFALSILFLFSMKQELNKTKNNLEYKYIRDKCPDNTGIEPTHSEDSLEKTNCNLSFSDFKSSVYDWKSASKEGGKINMQRLWDEYCTKGTWCAGAMRCLPNLLFFMLFAVAAILLSGGVPAPTRGDAAFYADKWISAISGITGLFLTMFIVDASRLSYKLIKHLEGNNENSNEDTTEDTPSDWPSSSRYAQDWGLRKDYVVYWIDIKFVADLTETIGSFIYYPIIVLLLLATARSSIFDDSVFSYGLAISISVLLLYLFSCAYLLQRGAKGMREKAITKLTKELRILQGNNTTVLHANKNEKEISRLKVMIEEIENTRKGAFTPFLQQPPVTAVLAVIGGGGGLPLLEQFL